MQSTMSVKYQAILVKLGCFFLPPSRGQFPKAVTSPSYRCPEHRGAQECPLKGLLSLVTSVQGRTGCCGVGVGGG